MTSEKAAETRALLIGKVSLVMSPEDAACLVDQVVLDAVGDARTDNEVLHRLWVEALRDNERLRDRLKDAGW